MPKSNFVVELVNAFNLCNCYFDDIYTNFTVKGAGVVGSFVPGTDIKEYSQKVKEEIIKRHYGTEEVASKYYNLNYFPFVLSDKGKKYVGKNLEVGLASSINDEVIHNLKIHFAQEFLIKVDTKVAVNLGQRRIITMEEAHKCIEGSVQLEKTDRSSPYLYCISFGDRYCKEKGYPSRFLEVFRNMYIAAFNEKLQECGLESSDFYESRDNKLYIKNITNIDVIKNIAKHLRERIALDFKTPGTEDSKVENFKDILSGLIFKWTGKSISAYESIEKGDGFFLVPLTKTCDDQLESLKRGDVYRTNVKYKNFLRDVKGKTADPDIVNCKNPVYGISNKKIAKVLPEIMQSPIAYNERTGHFEFAADLGPSSRIDSESPRQVSSVSSPVLRLQGGRTKGTGVAVPADDAKNNPDLSMSGQNPDEGYDYMQDSVNTRNLSDAERIRKRRNSDGRNLSADSALSSEFDASRSPSGMGMTDDSGVYSSQELPTSDPEGPIGPLPVRVVGNPQNPVYTCVMEGFQDSSEFDTMESDGKHKLDRGCPSRDSSGSTLSFSSSTSDTSVGTVIVGEDSSSESSPSRSASSEPFAAPSSSMGGVRVNKRQLVEVRE